MKTIKYLAMFLAAAGLFTGCSDDDDLNTQNQDKPKPTVSLTAGSVSDAEFSFTIAASENASQYAYAVFEGAGNTAPIAHDLVIDEVSGAYQSEAFNVSDAASQSVSVECESAATYQIFAAAITSTGLLGEVVSLEIHVDDTIAPVPQSFAPDGNKVTITYSEPIKVGAAGSATVRYMQWGSLTILEPVAIPKENISTEGNTATIVCEKPGNGAGYIVSFTEGLFEDLSGNKAAAINSSWSNQMGKFINIGWNTPNVDFPIEGSYFDAQTDEDDFNQPTATISLKFPFDVFDNEKSNSVQIIYNEPEELSYRNSSFTLEEDKRTVKVALPRVPTGAFDVQFAAGAFYDVWGNESAAFTVSPDALRYSNFQIEIKTGNYMISYTSGGEEVVNPNSGTPFAAQLEPYGKDFVLHANWFGMFRGFGMPDLVGTVDYANNRIVFDGRFLFNGSIYGRSAFAMGFYDYDEAGNYSLVFWGGGRSGTDPVTVTFDEDGYLTGISYCDYSIHDADGYFLDTYDCITDGKMEFVSESAGTAAAPSASKVYKALPTPRAGFSKK